MNTVHRCLHGLGINPRQYFAILDLFRKLTDRQEFELGKGEVSRSIVVGLSSLIMAVINIVVVLTGNPSLHSFIITNFFTTGLLLLMILLPDAINTFLNPVETSVLAHQPIEERTYFAAKFAYLLTVVATVVFPLNAIPAIVGLGVHEARWFYPVTHLISAYLLGVFIALTVCAVIGFLFRLIPVNRLRSLAATMQAAIFIVILVGPRLSRYARNIQFQPPAAVTAANPLNLFVALASIGQSRSALELQWPLVLGMALSVAFIASGVRSLSNGYLTNVQMLLRSSPRPRRSSHEWFGPIIRRLTGRPSGRAAFSFMYSMAKTDWQFRRTVIPLLVQFLALPLIGLVRGLGRSPFEARLPGAADFLPHLPGLAGLAICAMLTYSDQHHAAWIFLTAPLEGIRSFVRGIFWAIWLPFSAGSTLLLPLYIWYWGIADAMLFTTYSLAVGTLYVSVELFLIDGLPFANPPRQGSGFLAAPLVIGAVLVAGLLVALQWLFIFQDRLVTLGASLVFAGGGYLMAQVSLRHLETNVLHNLHLIASGRAAMFKEVE